MTIWSWLKLTAALWLIRKGFKVVGWLLMAAAAIAAWPLTAVAALGYLAAWLRGWPPSRLWRAAAWALPMTAVYAIGEALRLHAWQAVALAPVSDWANALGLLAAHAILRAGLLIAPVTPSTSRPSTTGTKIKSPSTPPSPTPHPKPSKPY